MCNAARIVSIGGKSMVASVETAGFLLNFLSAQPIVPTELAEPGLRSPWSEVDEGARNWKKKVGEGGLLLS